MAHLQHPVESGFSASSTVDEVLEGVDLSGRNVVITGGHSGLGLVMTRALSAAGASVTVGSRNTERAEAAVAGLERVEVSQLDLLDPESIEAFSQRWLDSGRPLHILINNAGYPASAEIERDARGCEAQFATNHLGHFQLTRSLYPALKAAGGARVVSTTSGAQRMSDILWDDPHFHERTYDTGLAYAQSKTANVLFAVELDRRSRDDDIRAFAAHPGVIASTAFNGAVGTDVQRQMGLIDEDGNAIIDPEHGKKTPEQGAATIVFGATSPMLEGLGGVYLNNSDVSQLNDDQPPVTADEIPADVVSHSIDPESARRLWSMSEQLLADSSQRD
ncbi:SDR family NAD(P)-dependent oxidoreductase [Paramicrobacterium fandaimingii]|uniref:SDR family NAD(P)-dependent oxidoreductase n=1 Tax=Paramicrobacterium fandaimingii TaxID=2708079 RepID=UPI00142416D6|nr:SDR family NAD(P)-dependent oxidoreductase [Microbacterium fandaimingii]